MKLNDLKVMGIEELSKSSGVPIAEVTKVLESLGITELAGKAQTLIPSHEINLADIRLSVRAGTYTIAR